MSRQRARSLVACTVAAVALGQAAALTPAARAATAPVFVQVDMNSTSAIALSSGGKVYAWGQQRSLNGGAYEPPLCIGTASVTRTSTYVPFPGGGGDRYDYKTRSSPALVTTPAGLVFTKVAAAGSALLALSSTGTLYAWGTGPMGVKGTGAGNRVACPTKVAFPPGVLIKDISASNVGGIVAVSRAGDLYTWGTLYVSICSASISRNTPYRIKPPVSGLTFTSAWSSTSELTMFARGSNSRVYWWIRDPYAPPSGCGSTFQTYYPTPRLLAQPTGVHFTTALSGIALSDARTLYLWGRNDLGQLGNGRKATGSWRATPAELTLPGGATPASIETTTDSVFAVTTGGVAYAWGYNGSGSLGVGASGQPFLTPTRVLMPAAATVVSVTGGGNGSFLALTKTGRIFGWGYNQVGVLGGNVQAEYSIPRLVG